MNSSFWLELLKHMPNWFYSLSAIIILFSMGCILWWLILGAKRFSNALGRENRLSELQDQLNQEKELHKSHENMALQLNIALENTQALLNSLNNIRTIQDMSIVSIQTPQLVQRAIENLASDIKSKSGERHRCGLWFEDHGNLKLWFANSGFPDHYIQNRLLDISRSVAGNCFLRKEIIKLDNVKDDRHWQPNPNSNSPYTALMCIPISTFGVLTIDALKPMKDDIVVIGKIYGRIIEGIMFEMLRSATPTSEGGSENVAI